MSTNQSMVNIINNIPYKSLDNKNKVATLEDRMAYYNTCGVSISVINNYEIDWCNAFGFKEA